MEIPPKNRSEAKAIGAKNFSTGKPCRKGHLAPRFTTSGECYVCNVERQRAKYVRHPRKAPHTRAEQNEYHRRYYRKNAAKIRKQATARGRLSRNENPVGTLFYNIQKSAKHLEREFTITQADLEPVPTHCPCCGREMLFHPSGPRQSNSVSIDRLDSSRGYIPGNVNLICWGCNSLKRNATAPRLRQIADWIDRVTPRLPLAA